MRFIYNTIIAVLVLSHCCSGRSVLKRHTRNAETGDTQAGSQDQEYSLIPSDNDDDNENEPSVLNLPLDVDDHESSLVSDHAEVHEEQPNEPLENRNSSRRSDEDKISAGYGQQQQLTVTDDTRSGEQSQHHQTGDIANEHTDNMGEMDHDIEHGQPENIGDNVDVAEHGDQEHIDHTHEVHNEEGGQIDHEQMRPEIGQTSVPILTIGLSRRDGIIGEETDVNTTSSEQSGTVEGVTINIPMSTNRSQGRRELPENELNGHRDSDVHLLLDASLNHEHITEEPNNEHLKESSTESQLPHHDTFLLEPGVGVNHPGQVVDIQHGDHENGEILNNHDGEPPSIEEHSSTESVEQREHEAPVIHGVTLSQDGLVPHDRHPGENVEPEIILRNPNHTSTTPRQDNHNPEPGQGGVDIPIRVPVNNNSNSHKNVEHGQQINPLIIHTLSTTQPTTTERINILPSPAIEHEQNQESSSSSPGLSANSSSETDNENSGSRSNNENGEPASNNEGGGSVIDHHEGGVNGEQERSENEHSGAEILCNGSIIATDNSESEGTELESSGNGEGNKAIDRNKAYSCKPTLTESQPVPGVTEENIVHSTTAINVEPTTWSETNILLVTSESPTEYIPEYSSTESNMNTPYLLSVGPYTDYAMNTAETANTLVLSSSLITFLHSSSITPTFEHVLLSTHALPTITDEKSTETTNVSPSIESLHPSAIDDLKTTFISTSYNDLTSGFPTSYMSEFSTVLDNVEPSPTVFEPATSTLTSQSSYLENIEPSTTIDSQQMTTEQFTVTSSGPEYVSPMSVIASHPTQTSAAHQPATTSISTNSQPSTQSSSTNSDRFITDASTISRTPSTNNTTSIRVLIRDRSTKAKLPDSTTPRAPITSKKPGARKPTEKPAIYTSSTSTTSRPAYTARHPATLPDIDRPDPDTVLRKTTKGMILTTPPQVFVQIYIRMSTCQFYQQKPNFISELKDLIITEKQVRIEYEQFVVQIKNIPEGYCKDVPNELVIGEETLDQVTVDMYIVDKKGNIDIRLTYDASTVIQKGFTDARSAFKDKIVRVAIQGNKDDHLVTNHNNVKTVQTEEEQASVTMVIVLGSVGGCCCVILVILQVFRVAIQGNQDDHLVTNQNNVKTVQTEEEQASVTMVIVLGSVGGCCCVILVILQVVLIHRRVTSKRKASYLSRRLSVRSSDNVALGTIPKGGRPNSGYWNPAFSDMDLYDTKHSHLMNYSELANFCMEVTDIYDEFQTIPCEIPDSSVVPLGEEDKNRFANVLPYRQSRVKLKMRRTDKSDYINANYVTGYKNHERAYIATQSPLGYKNHERAYIATQSPLVNTVEDFWRMVWEQQSRVILMLNPVMTNRKPKQSTCYWPDNIKTDVRRLYGDFSVTLIKRDVQQDYIECTLELMDLEVNLKREIRHFWFTCWPESSVLEPLKLVKFILDSRPQYENSGAPVVVHCGPGQGRSGALIAVDVCMRRFEDKRRVDILNCVYKMRKERAGAVHNKEQYALIYQALNEYAVLLSSPSLSTRSSIITLHAML